MLVLNLKAIIRELIHCDSNALQSSCMAVKGLRLTGWCAGMRGVCATVKQSQNARSFVKQVTGEQLQAVRF